MLAFPLAFHLFSRLPDRGYTFAKPLALILVSYVVWMLGLTQFVPNSAVTILAILLVISAISGWLLHRHKSEVFSFLRAEWKSILVAEGVFLGFFIFWLLVVSDVPAINHTEQPMDFMYLNASIQTDIGTPEDPWLRGEPISYYYFGYWMYGAIAKFTGIASQISFNLALAVIPAMSAVGAFGLVYNMVRAESRRFRRAIGAGILAAVLLTGIANLEGVLEFGRANSIGSSSFYEWVGIDGLEKAESEITQSWKPDEFWWWWRASRVVGMKDAEHTVDYTITEFPFFSFMLGDMHPHVMSIPLVLLFLTACYNYLLSPKVNRQRASIRTVTGVCFIGLALGGLGFTNMWDFPVFAAVFLGIVALRSYSMHGLSLRVVGFEMLPILLLVFGVALISISPYLLNYSGLTYLFLSVVFSSYYVFISYRLFKSKDSKLEKKLASKLFSYSIFYLFMIFTSILIDRIV